jgi:hypothetical protein
MRTADNTKTLFFSVACVPCRTLLILHHSTVLDKTEKRSQYMKKLRTTYDIGSDSYGWLTRIVACVFPTRTGVCRLFLFTISASKLDYPS